MLVNIRAIEAGWLPKEHPVADDLAQALMVWQA